MVDRPLWKLLLITKDDDELAERPLTCTECFTILEYLVDLVSQQQSNEQIKQAVKNHLTTCSNCHTYYLKKLTELEDLESTE